MIPSFEPSPPKSSFKATGIMFSLESSSTVMLSSAAVGKSFTAITVIVAVALTVSPFASVIA